MDFAAVLDRSSLLPLQKQMYEQWRGAVLSGRFAPGARVPSTRDLARSLGVSRTTVTQAYEQLIAEGYLEATRGSGTYVCAALPEEMLRTDSGASGSDGDTGDDFRFRFSRYGRALRERPGQQAIIRAALSRSPTGSPISSTFPLPCGRGWWREPPQCRSRFVRLRFAISGLCAAAPAHCPLRGGLASSALRTGSGDHMQRLATGARSVRARSR